MRLSPKSVWLFAAIALFLPVLWPAPAGAVGGPNAGFVLAPGAKATATGVGFGACNNLTWGYQVDGGPEQPKGSKGDGCFSQAAADVNIGPFQTPVTLRFFLRDNTCGKTYFSDGTPVDHFIISASSPYDIRVADGGGFCERAGITFNSFAGSNFHLTLRIPPAMTVDAGASYTAERATPVALHATAKNAIGDVQYTWTFTPGVGCPSNTPLTHTTEPGADITITPLCGLGLNLHGTDSTGQSADATATVAVDPRHGSFSATPVTHEEQPSSALIDGRTPQTEPVVIPVGDGYSLNMAYGLNVSACSAASTTDHILCPDVDRAAVRQPGSGGYALSTVADPNGPFDGFSYVSDTSISIKRIALINPYIQSDGPRIRASGPKNWYQHNLNAGRDVAGFRLAVSQHEGEGTPSNPALGHTGALRLASIKPESDPRAVLEAQFAPTQAAAISSIDNSLDSVEALLQIALKSVDAPGTPIPWNDGKGNLLEFFKQPPHKAWIATTPQ